MQTAYESPVLSAVVALTLAWGLARYLFYGQGMTASGGAANPGGAAFAAFFLRAHMW